MKAHRLLALAALAYALRTPALAVSAPLEVHAGADFVLQRFDQEREDGAPSGLRARGGLSRAVVALGQGSPIAYPWGMVVSATHGALARGEPPDPGATRRGGLAADVVRIEQAVVARRLGRALSLQAGLLPVPLGWSDDPVGAPVEPGVSRNEVQRRVIPHPWSAAGVALLARWPAGIGPQAAGVSLEAAVLGGIDPARLGADAGLRDAHAPLAHAALGHPAIAVSATWDAELAGIGGSLYATDARHDALRTRVTLAEAHARAGLGPLRTRALYAMGTIGDHVALDRALGLEGTSDALGKRFFGGFAEAAWRLFPGSDPPGAARVEPFVRFELTDTQDGVGPVGTEDPSRHRTAVVAGVGVTPCPGVRIALDRQQRHDEVRTQASVWEAAISLWR